MSPSVRENFRFGKRPQMSAHTRSPSVEIAMADDSIIFTLAGASFDVCDDRDDEPMWQHSTVPSSEQAPNSGPQYPEWIDGMSRASGFSEKVTAWHPLAARRRPSPADRSGSNGGRPRRGRQ